MFATDAPRILIARMSAIGDTVLTLPVACALRRRFPRAFIGWVVEATAAPMVLGHPCLDEVIVLQRGWYVSPLGIATARHRLRPFGFEISVDCQSVSKTALACWLSGATHRIGCDGQYGCEISPYLNNDLLTPRTTHLTDRSLELLCRLGIESPTVDWQLPLVPAAREKMADLVSRLGLGDAYAVINPGATWDSKLWPPQRFAAVARYLGSRHGIPTLVVWGNSSERIWANEIIAASAGHAVLAPPTDLAELAAVIHRSKLFISADTGPLHIAVAVGTPSIGLYGATRPQDCGPYGEPHIAIQTRYESGSRQHRRQASNACMKLISSEMVCRQCDELMARGRKRQDVKRVA